MTEIQNDLNLKLLKDVTWIDPTWKTDQQIQMTWTQISTHPIDMFTNK